MQVLTADDNNTKIGRATSVSPVPANIDALCKAVKTEMGPDLAHTSAARLEVYAAGTTAFAASDALDPADGVPGGTSSRAPLVVRAPPPLPVAAPASQQGTVLGMQCPLVLCFAFLATLLSCTHRIKQARRFQQSWTDCHAWGSRCSPPVTREEVRRDMARRASASTILDCWHGL